jgi:hypothetical protein
MVIGVTQTDRNTHNVIGMTVPTIVPTIKKITGR